MKHISSVGFILLLMMTLGGCTPPAPQVTEKQPVETGMTEAQAKTIAEATCIKGGESLATGYYNEITKTWWFDANLNSTNTGCNPACVVFEETKTAEINWRCTGAIPSTEESPVDSI